MSINSNHLCSHLPQLLLCVTCLLLFIKLSRTSSPVNFTLYAKTKHDCCKQVPNCRACESYSVKTDECLSFGWFELSLDALSISTDGCLRTWDAPTCTGDSLQIQPGSPCEPDLSKCEMSSGSRKWNQKVMAVSGCNFVGHPTSSASITEPPRQVLQDDLLRCPPGTWVMEIRMTHKYSRRLELDCFAPGAINKAATRVVIENVGSGEESVTSCDYEPMKGIAIYLGNNSVVIGHCNRDHRQTQYSRRCVNRNTAVCGISMSTQDDLGLQGEPMCCPLPDPWTTKTIGTALQPRSRQNVRLIKFYSAYDKRSGPSSNRSLAISVAAELSSEFALSLGESSVTHYNWARSPFSIWKPELVTHTLTFQVPSGTRVVLEQVIGLCGFMEVRTEQLRRTDYDKYPREFASPTAVAPSPEMMADRMLPTTTAASAITQAKESTTVLLIGVGSSAAIFFTTTLLFLYCKYRALQIQHRLTNEELKRFHHGLSSRSQTENEYLSWDNFSYNRLYEVVKGRLIIDLRSKLGSGQYGVVYKGQLKPEDGVDAETGPSTIAVAVKTVRPGAPKEYFLALMSELKLLAHIGHHENIANLLGSYSENIENMELYVCVELCAGSLLQFLRHNRHTFQDFVNPGPEPGSDSEAVESSFNEPAPASQNQEHALPNPMKIADLIQWATDIATGMEYLALERVVHADLAARNVLLSLGFRAKICDFGLARQLIGCEYIKRLGSGECFLPWKWMAIESLTHMQFTTMSDVWSFGVTCWEIFSLGAVPYPCLEMSWDFVQDLINGQRLSRPQYANTQVNEMMLSCWRKDKGARPTFTNMKAILHEQIHSSYNQL